MMSVKYDIFISYSSANRDSVIPFYTRLIQEGFRVFIDMDGIKTGESFISKIVTAIESSELMLFFRSKESNQSKYTLRELKYADDINIPIVPVFLDNDKSNKQINFVLTSFDCEDYSGINKNSDVFEHIIDSVKSLLDERKEPPSIALFNSIEQAYYHIGDRYYANGNVIGIVCQLDQTGKHGKIISTLETDGPFFHPTPLNKTNWGDLQLSTTDGQHNMAEITHVDDWENLFPIVKWCERLGVGWYIPAIEELESIIEHIPTINSSLTELQLQPLPSYLVSSSSSKYSSNSLLLIAKTSDGSYRSFYNDACDYYVHGRAMRDF